MTKSLLLIACFFYTLFSSAQSDFELAYATYPLVPEGLLEAVAWNNTRMVHLNESQEGCSGIPLAYGIMGLHDDGKGYFFENGNFIAQQSGISVSAQKASAANQILAYASTFHQGMQALQGVPQQKNSGADLRDVLLSLSEIPDSGIVNNLARNMQVYEVLSFLNSVEKASEFGFTPSNTDLKVLFGEENYRVLSAKKIEFTPQGIQSDKGNQYAIQQNKSIEYGPAIWNPAPTCNFSSRQGTAISAITIHTVQGTYAGAISWAQNCNSDVSYHYVIRSSDGQVTQMVSEADKAWHVGTENPYTIGYEHEGYVNNAAWYTEEMYNSSADLSRDIVNSGYGILPLRTFDGPASSGTNVLGGCIKIKGHQHYPNQTHVDPGINWDWEKYYQLINNPPSIITVTSSTGTLTDTGGAAGDYPDDERQLWLIQPPTALSITLDFSVFSLENNWDYLYIYDGDTLTDPVIGIYTGTNSPGTIISSGGSLLLEFRSDCATVAEGWVASYTETTADATPPLTAVVANNSWNTDDFLVNFVDTDAQSGVDKQFYLSAKKDVLANDWTSDGSYGFAYESFEDGNANWLPVTGTFSLNGGAYEFNDAAEQNSNTYMAVDQNNANSYVFEWDQTITSAGANQRAGMHFFCDNPNLPNRGNSYFIYIRESDDKVQIYQVNNDVFTLEQDINFPIAQGQTYNCKTFFNPVDGVIKVYIDDSLAGEWQDLTPLPSGGFISLRTGGCEVQFDNIHVYQSRGTQVNIPAGIGELMDLESEGAVPTARVLSLVIDSAENWSNPSSEDFLLDFTVPNIDYLYDGSGADIDTFETTTLNANWNAFDIHSDIANYEIAIGTLPTFDNIVPWTDNGVSAAFTTILANPVYNQVYYLSLRVTNNAGLMEQFMSDGQRFVDDLGVVEHNPLEDIQLYPNPANAHFSLSNLPGEVTVRIYDAQGKLSLSSNVKEDQLLSIEHLAQGTYNVIIMYKGAFIVERLIIQ